MPQIDRFLQFMVGQRGSDLHVSVGSPPMIRVDGDMLKMNMGPLNKDQVWNLISEIIPEHNLEQFTKDWDTDFAYELPGVARFRVNVFTDRRGPGTVMRTIPAKIWTCDDLGLSKEIRTLCLMPKGLVIVTGPTGSGKSTTLAALVRECNEKRKDHIITIEDPIEFVHDNISCLINQREVHQHTRSFSVALRAALREDPDIVLIGEMRDLETVRIALETAETGHLVFATLHTNTAASTVDRIIDQFPADQQEQIRVMLSTNLKAVIAQTLLKKKGSGRVAALEILIVTSAVANLIRENKTFQIGSQIETGKKYGMMPLNDALIAYIEKGVVDPKEAYMKALDKIAYSEKVMGVLLNQVKSGQLKPADAIMSVFNTTEMLNGFTRIGMARDQVEQLRAIAERKAASEMEV
ncbi:MAG: type IV pilus twitching motility protein PilT [Planctomycetes bacterium]|nr:type IV pilus twitching motility protein PilT [Planctomycetota bacterium]